MNPPSDAQGRRATPEDAGQLAELRYEFRAARGPTIESRDVFVRRTAEWMCSRLPLADRWRAWVADVDGHPAGCIWLQLIEKLPNPAVEAEWHGYLTNFFVRPEFRNRGIGSMLLRAFLTDCANLAVDTIFLWPTPESRALYQRHGFSLSTDVFTAEMHDDSRHPGHNPEIAARSAYQVGPGGG